MLLAANDEKLEIDAGINYEMFCIMFLILSKEVGKSLMQPYRFASGE